MARKNKYRIPTLLAAGLTPFAATASEQPQDTAGTHSSLFDDIKKIVTGIGESHSFTLAQHQSHQSHGSHQSHRSSSYRMTPPEEGRSMKASLDSRNLASTPANSVLPSSPAIANKLKVLPGNSEKFRMLVTHVQVALQARGYDAGSVNGEVHARTVAALYRYQQDSGFMPTGKLTNETLSSLGITAQ